MEGFEVKLLRSSIHYWFNLIASSLILLAILSFIEVISWNHNKRFDLTPTKRYTLSPFTKNLLQGLTGEVKVVVFYQRDQQSGFEDLLRQYASASSKFRYEFYNLDRNPGKAKQYGITTDGAAVVEYEGKRKVYPYCTEENITNGIISLVQKRIRRVYFLQGQGEHSPEDTDQRKGYSTIASALAMENYESKTLLLLHQRAVPPDAAVLVVSGPTQDLTEGELALISDYLKQGGKALFMVDPYTAPTLVSFLSSYGIILGNDTVVDQESRIFGGDYLSPIIGSYRKHEITRNFEGATIMPLVRSVDVKEELNPEVDVKTLARSGPESYAKTDRKMIEEGHLDFEKGKDRKGPVPVMTVATIPAAREGSEAARIAVFGGSTFASNLYVNLLGNKDLFLNTVNWLVGEEKLISIRPKEKQVYPFSFFFLTDSQMRIIFWTSVIIQPVLVLFIGLIIYARRRIRG
jgi:ABC-type uncharacterized transport system involved in gliding motility auxiliary subunit